VLRACHSVLRPGGRIAGYTIHTAADLDDADAALAAELGPMAVNAEHSPTELLRAAGFRILLEEDVTATFQSTAAAFWRAREDLADSLRFEEGDARFDEEQQSTQALLDGIARGLLLRSLHVGLKVEGVPMLEAGQGEVASYDA
jgi:hypothetical protein